MTPVEHRPYFTLPDTAVMVPGPDLFLTTSQEPHQMFEQISNALYASANDESSSTPRRVIAWSIAFAVRYAVWILAAAMLAWTAFVIYTTATLPSA